MTPGLRPTRPFAGLRALLGGLAALVLALAGPALAAPKFPPLTGRVVDDAHVLPAATQAELTNKLAALEAQTRRQLVVVTLPSLQGYDIADFGYQLGRAWGIGQKAQPGAEKDNGVLFIVAPSERSVRIEVGYGLEGVLTDALSSVILQTQVLPRFRAGDVPGGVTAGADALITQLGLPPDQAAAAVQKAAQRPAAQGEGSGLGLLPLLFILFVLFSIFRGGRRGGMGWITPMILGGLASRGRRDDDWGGGGWGGGGGGGGFGGGGGSFGGGGASGRW